MRKKDIYICSFILKSYLSSESGLPRGGVGGWRGTGHGPGVSATGATISEFSGLHYTAVQRPGGRAGWEPRPSAPALPAGEVPWTVGPGLGGGAPGTEHSTEQTFQRLYPRVFIIKVWEIKQNSIDKNALFGGGGRRFKVINKNRQKKNKNHFSCT